MAIDSDPLVAADVVRGTTRLLLRHDWLPMPEVPLGNGRRADLLAICAKGTITIVEVKVSKADLLCDAKWPEYLDYCDRYFWAVPQGFDLALLERPELMPDRAGLIVADRYDAEMVRSPIETPLPSPRRKAETLRLARRAVRRLLLGNDSESES